MESSKTKDADSRDNTDSVNICHTGNNGMSKALVLASLVIMAVFVVIMLNPGGKQASGCEAKTFRAGNHHGNDPSMPAEVEDDRPVPDTGYHFDYDPEVEAEYPGGTPAWLSYLKKNIHYPDVAANNGVQGIVLVRFVVDKEGNVSDVQAVSGPISDSLREEAIRIIRNSHKWKPATQGEHPVKSYKSQPVVFHLEED